MVSRMNGTSRHVDIGKMFIFSALLAMWLGLAGCGNKGWAAGEGRDNGNIKVRGGTVWIKDKIHARVFDLAIHRTSEGRDGLLDVHIGAHRHPTAVVLLGVHRLATDLTRCALNCGRGKQHPRGLGLQGAET